ncbi:MAG TPA: prepilin peptidase [Candidatus Ratteibacteria bacterium]|jgi:leader peptidase (prepilin peptidase)/N-methyltransferase|uniref:Prepilin leader peptidase/N-methyltransferase n=1 Tax=candidate division TA06 bacterium ADurb.Bin131 TaxID=1852827 RepID=A0A1V6CBC5_UNCT6|nr:MAG: Type 4 prepilin-like proteins leader peptide-processing enzyme [candidate division TA06 bacterium ADurb.Bin131]HOC01926.1 prepilin peptidase [bacterium]HON05848.1 prepilin peptidase [bacterium]HRS06452.1 prepilin peptidase [Candidatus Ratteibacteria bacterium]HRV04741.1 prepilin peptidase [Candidatus Ratteibacteria bacterium]
MREILVFLIGACFGSFANVCIYRMPRKKSIVFPSSFCPKCRRSIRWYDNIPILSYILLRGRCRYCKKTISPRYPIVEATMGLLALLLYEKFWTIGLYCPFFFYFIFALGMLIISGIDFETFLVPDIIVIPLIPIGIIGAFLCENFFFFPSGQSSAINRLMYSISGAFTGALIVAALAIIGKIIWKKEAMGGGDLKLLAAIGAFLGWKGVFISIFFGSIIGTIISLLLIYSKKKTWDDYIPFGPYLVIGAIITILMKGSCFLSLYFIP